MILRLWKMPWQRSVLLGAFLVMLSVRLRTEHIILVENTMLISGSVCIFILNITTCMYTVLHMYYEFEIINAKNSCLLKS